MYADGTINCLSLLILQGANLYRQKMPKKNFGLPKRDFYMNEPSLQVLSIPCESSIPIDQGFSRLISHLHVEGDFSSVTDRVEVTSVIGTWDSHA
jgi:hypothetical protein